MTSSDQQLIIGAPQLVCDGCPFGGPKVGSKGDPRSPLVIVGESPGANEVRKKIPFAGASGMVIHKYIPEGSAYFLNAMECSPHKRAKDQRTLAYAARNCNTRLIRYIQEHPRKLIIAMGNPAVWTLTGDYTLKITQIRGQLIPSPLAEHGILPMVHPAALMRGTGNFRQFKEDLQNAWGIIQDKQPEEFIPPTWEVIDWAYTHRMDKIIEYLSQQEELTGDIETSGFDHQHDRILSFGITDKKGEHVYCFTPTPLVLRRLKPLLESPSIKWAWHNGKFDVKFFREKGIEARVDDDTMLMSYTLDERGGVHDLEQVAQDVLNMPDYKDMLKPYLPNKKTSYEVIPKPVLNQYMAYDVAATARIRPVYRARIQKDKALEKLYTRTLIPASELLTRLESNGFYVDQEWMRDTGEYLLEQINTSTKAIQEICGRAVNPGSPTQMKDVLYRQFRLPNKFKGSTNKDALKFLLENESTRHPVVLELKDFRLAAKAYGTYVKGMMKWIRPDGRIYSTYKLHGTVTGRLASSDPNLQNIPRDWIIRGMFCVPDGKFLLEIDLSQAELRSLAALSEDPDMCQIYLDDGDIHSELAIALFPGWAERKKAPKGSPEERQAYEERVKCKNVNFGIIYGITEFGLQDQIGGPISDSRRMLQGWGKRFPKAWAFIEKCRATPQNNQIITTCFGRKKRVGLVTQGNIRFLQNEAANFPHQSSASDITLHAAMKVEPQLRQWGVKIVNLVHDSIIMEVDQDLSLINRTIELVKDALENTPREWGITRVPFKADADIGYRWGSLEDYNDWLKNGMRMTEAA